MLGLPPGSLDAYLLDREQAIDHDQGDRQPVGDALPPVGEWDAADPFSVVPEGLR